MLSLLLVLLVSVSALSAYVDKEYYPLASIKNTSPTNSVVAITTGAKPPASLSDEEVKSLVYEALTLTDFSKLLTEKVKTVLLKPNIVEPLASGSGVITDNRVVRFVATFIYEIRPDIRIIIGEGAGGWVPKGYEWGAFPGAKAEDGFQIADYRSMVKSLKKQYPNLQIEIVDLNIPKEAMVEVKPSFPLSEDTYYVHHLVKDCDLYVSLPVLKIIETCQVTLGLKNNVGIAPGVIYGWSKNRGFPYTQKSGGLRHHFHLIDKEIIDLVQVRVPDFTLIDGIMGMEQDKTNFRRGIKKQANLIIAGQDPVATDAAACLVMGLNPRDIEHITLAYYLGLGSISPTVVGTPLESVVSKWIKPLTKYSPRGHFGQGVRIFSVAKDMEPYSEPLLFMDTLINPWALGPAETYSLKTGFRLVEDLDLELWVGSDTNLMVLIDDQPVYEHKGRRKHALPNDIVPLKLTSGDHSLEVRIGPKGVFSLNLAEVLPKNIKDADKYSGTTPLSLTWRWED